MFRRPVDIGDLLRLKSRVTYSSGSLRTVRAPNGGDASTPEVAPPSPTVVVEVTCQVVSPERASSCISNTFHFVFGFEHSSPPHSREQRDHNRDAADVVVRTVLATTAEEAAALLHGHRLCAERLPLGPPPVETLVE